MTTLAHVGFCCGGGELSERVMEENTALTRYRLWMRHLLGLTTGNIKNCLLV